MLESRASECHCVVTVRLTFGLECTWPVGVIPL
jgi:hypothetical protein